MKIACWSGPRNISTALMRSWSSRNDTFVSDEPFYAYYLKKTRLKHPMYKEIINYYPNSLKGVLKFINGKIPKSKNIWYQKHMAHHLLELEELKWLENFHNCFLIRHPRQVIPSYIKKNKLYKIEELGYKQQNQMIDYLVKNKKKFIIIDSNVLLENPKEILEKWCEKINIEYNPNMLKWEKGQYDTDGIWYEHWYDSVIKTNRFKKNTNNVYRAIDKDYLDIYNEALYYYNEMNSLAIK